MRPLRAAMSTGTTQISTLCYMKGHEAGAACAVLLRKCIGCFRINLLAFVFLDLSFEAYKLVLQLTGCRQFQCLGSA